MTAAPRPTVIVVGAGIIGTLIAFRLQAREGLAVTLLDRDAPETARGASAGHASILNPDAILPFALPGFWRKLPGLLADPDGPLALRAGYLPMALPWLLRRVLASRTGRVRGIAAALRALHAPVLDLYGELLREVGATSLLVGNGVLHVWEAEAPPPSHPMALALSREGGVVSQVFAGDGLHALEPALGPRFRSGRLFPRSAHCLDPAGLLAALRQAFRNAGGALRQDRAVALAEDSAGVRVICESAGVRHAARVVIAAGAWSGELLATVGVHVPLQAERGYHVDVAATGVSLGRPVLHARAGVVATPLAGRLRLAGLVEIDHRDALPDLRKPEVLLRHGRALLPGLQVHERQDWLGARPSTPDSLPVIGPLPGRPRIMLAFGHGNAGVIGAPMTAMLVADMMAARPTMIDPAPYAMQRFTRLS
jgi:D-amino-acid dehydrogenase